MLLAVPALWLLWPARVLENVWALVPPDARARLGPSCVLMPKMPNFEYTALTRCVPGEFSCHRQHACLPLEIDGILEGCLAISDQQHWVSLCVLGPDDQA